MTSTSWPSPKAPCVLHHSGLVKPRYSSHSSFLWSLVSSLLPGWLLLLRLKNFTLHLRPSRRLPRCCIWQRNPDLSTLRGPGPWIHNSKIFSCQWGYDRFFFLVGDGFVVSWCSVCSARVDFIPAEPLPSFYCNLLCPLDTQMVLSFLDPALLTCTMFCVACPYHSLLHLIGGEVKIVIPVSGSTRGMSNILSMASFTAWALLEWIHQYSRYRTAVFIVAF